MRPPRKAYPASLIDPDFPGQTVEGELTCSQWELRFESDLRSVALSWNGLQIHTAGGTGDQVFFHHPDMPEISLFAPDGAILSNPLLAARAGGNLRREQSSRRRHFLFRNVVLFFGGLICLVLALYWLAGAAVNLAVAAISPAQERVLGHHVAAGIESRVERVKAPKLERQLNALVDRLTRGGKLREPLKVEIIDWASPNAFAVPGGRIFVTTGLLRFVRTPEEIAGVLAHEITHIKRRHGIRLLIQSLGPAYALRLWAGKGSGMAGLLASGTEMLVRQRFSREHEREADAGAWEALQSARIDPRGMLDFFERLRGMESNFTALPGPWSSHPATDERIQEWKERLRSAPRGKTYEPVTLDLSAVPSEAGR